MSLDNAQMFNREMKDAQKNLGRCGACHNRSNDPHPRKFRGTLTAPLCDRCFGAICEREMRGQPSFISDTNCSACGALNCKAHVQ
jgi:hypothetical protein